jgi:hypothetical protein
MKKFYVLLAVAAMVCVSSIALAADVTVGGNLSLRDRMFDSLTFNKKSAAGDTVDTQTKWMLDINAKTGDTKAKISLWNDFDTWGGPGSTEHQEGVALTSGTTGAGGADNHTHSYSYNNNSVGAREAWVSFPVLDTGFTIKGGHQLLKLSNGLFLNQSYFGTDAWVALRDDGPNHFVFVNIKAFEGSTAANDDVDAYVFIDTFKINTDMTVGADLTLALDRKNTLLLGGAGNTEKTEAQNIGVNFAGKVGPVGLKAEFDQQMGKAKGNDAKFSGNVLWVRGDVAMDPAAVNFTVARGSGRKSTDTNYKQYVTFLDIDPHVGTLLYEYKLAGACGLKNQGFCNTTAVNAGAMFAATKSLSIGADLWYLTATEKVSDKVALASDPASTKTSSDLGIEVDVKINWKLAENLSWNWWIGMLDPGDGLGKDMATGVQGILAYTF